MALTIEKRNKMEKLIYDFFSAIDKTGANTKKYKEFFSQMSDRQFDNYFKALFANDKAYIILELKDYEHTLTMEDLERGAKVLDIPLFEYVYLPYATMDKNNIICTKQKVPVGYIHIKRPQQTIAKKNGISTDISERSGITNQVTGKAKNGRESDLENIMITSVGLTSVLKEVNGPRADDMVMKNQMLRDISVNGYTSLENMTSDPANKTTLNTVDVYLLGMGIKSDLVTTGLMLQSVLDEEL